MIYFVTFSGTFYDRGKRISVICFLNDGVPLHKSVRMPSLFRKMMFLRIWAMGFFFGVPFDVLLASVLG